MIRSCKECFKCKTVKPIDGFYKHQRMADGHLNKCIECTKKDASNHRDKNLEKIRAYDRERAKNIKRIKASKEITRNWSQEDKRRSIAHSAVSRAIKNGILAKAACFRCGDTKSLAHHEDYDKPLDVIWLCQPCHKQRHKEIFRSLVSG
jgi:ribosomal protein S27AE